MDCHICATLLEERDGWQVCPNCGAYGYWDEVWTWEEEYPIFEWEFGTYQDYQERVELEARQRAERKKVERENPRPTAIVLTKEVFDLVMRSIKGGK